MAEIIELPLLERFSFRGNEKACAEVSTAFDITLPQQACTATTIGTRSALWLGPDEWLLIGNGFNLMPLNSPHALVDISHRQIAIQLSGNHAADMLNMACPLDLDETVFTVGMCTRTVFGKAEIVLWRRDVQAFHIEVWRSFAGYVLGLLDVAKKEHV